MSERSRGRAVKSRLETHEHHARTRTDGICLVGSLVEFPLNIVAAFMQGTSTGNLVQYVADGLFGLYLLAMMSLAVSLEGAGRGEAGRDCGWGGGADTETDRQRAAERESETETESAHK